jgi:outer membrane beta-barrel protein
MLSFRFISLIFIFVCTSIEVSQAQPSKEDFDLLKKVIIQKNYMPKTERWHLSGGLTFMPNDVFFKTFGANLKASYHFNEQWGAEAVYISFSSQKSQDLKDLEDKQGVTAANIASVKNYTGAQVYHSSIYGKYAFYDRIIYPFEIYQYVGAGVMGLTEGTAPAISLGMGQLVSLSRNSALRFDLNLLMYTAETASGSKQSANTLLLTLSYSRFFPEVGKRW